MTHQFSFTVFVRRYASAAAVAGLVAALGIESIPSCAQESKNGKVFTQTPELGDVTVSKESDSSAKSSADLIKNVTNAKWIWGSNPDGKYTAKKTFTLDDSVTSAKLFASCDNRMVLSVNGKKVGSSDEWKTGFNKDVAAQLKRGENEISVEIRNEGGASGFVAMLTVFPISKKPYVIVTDDSWKISASGKADVVEPTKIVGSYGDQPWGNVFDDKATDDGVKAFQTLPGFVVDKIFTVPRDQLGSWVCLTTDNKGRLIASDQGNLGLCRITPPAVGSNEVTKVEKLDADISSAQGLLYAFDSLYVSVNGGKGSGLYRLKDTNGDDQFDEVVKIKEFRGAGEHGPHALRLSPDGKSIYVCCGNHTQPPYDRETNAPNQTMGGARSGPFTAKLSAGNTSRIAPNWDEDLLLPRQWDANGHAVGIVAPGGWVAKTDPDGKTWEVFSMGYRNEFDFAFNNEGEMFVYDADMEWDVGTPWYRPTRVVHATSGSEFGWRSGTGKWPSYYLDSLPSLVDIGPGSPVGVEFGYGTKFPAKYQKALFICDWTFGTMYAIHTDAEGASYKGSKEEFVARTPLPLTDVTVGKDGNLYFTIGGRGAQSELYRVRYVGTESTAAIAKEVSNTPAVSEAQSLRKKIEALHVDFALATQGKDAAKYAKESVEFLLPLLSHAERHIRYAARVALERIPTEFWAKQALAKWSVDNGATIAAALARTGAADVRDELLQKLNSVELSSLPVNQTLDYLRANQLVLIRLGALSDQQRLALLKKFEPVFPTKVDAINRELSILLVYLEAPSAPSKIVALLGRERTAKQDDYGDVAVLERNKGYGQAINAMLANQPDAEQMHLAFTLRNQKTGWTLDERKAYFKWFEKAATWSGGNSYQKFLINMSNDAYANCNDQERFMLEAVGARKSNIAAKELPKPQGPGKTYDLKGILELTKSGLSGRNFENGKKMYAAARCVVCHRYSNDGGATGPDLTQLAGRFSTQDLAEAILDPSKVISDQYKTTIIQTTDGKVYTGRVITEFNNKLTLVTDPEDASKTVTIDRADIEGEKPSPVSLMPKELINGLNEQEVLDLFAYLLSRGNKDGAMFKK